MKIAFILGGFPTLSETFILNQITGLIDRGHQVEIFAKNKIEHVEIHEDVKKYNLLDKTNYSEMPLNKFYRLIKGLYLIITNIFFNPVPILKSLNFIKYKKNSLNLSLLYTVVNFLNEEKEYDIIHCHFGYNGVLGQIMKDLDLISGKLITTFHGSDVTSNYEDNREKYKIIFNKADLCTVNSNFLRKKVVDLDCNKNKIKRLPVGVDLNFFRPKRKKYNNKKEELIIISVARLVEYKGLEYSIKAVSEIIKKYPEKKVKYYIVGNGKEKSNLKKLINKLELNNFVTLEGGKKREEVKKYYNQSDIFILPSINYHDGREEAQGLVLQEAQAMGLPVISTNVGGIPEGVIAKKTGFIVQDKSVDQLANKIEFFIKNPDEIKKMGQAGRKYIKENFDQEKLNDSLEAIYFSLKS